MTFAPKKMVEARPDVDRRVPAPPDTTGRVLVVDDDPQGRQMLADWLAAYGHDVSTAADGPEALRRAAANPPDVVLLDVMMPGMDGYTVCEHLRRDAATAMVPVLFLTALDDREDRLRGMKAGANDFLTKPADLPYVLLRVRNAVRIKQLHDEVQVKLRDLRALEKLKDSLLQMVIHDLRTPLAGLEGYLQLLQMAAAKILDERCAHYLRQALHGTHRLAHEIDLLLDIHRLEEGRMPVSAVPHDLARVLEEALEPLRPLVGHRQLRIETSAGSCTALGDPRLLARVLTNLIGNAIAFTAPEGGEIVIRVVPAEGHARVEVADNGPGIEASQHEEIFEKFRQAGETVRARSSGLGLAFCKLAVEAQEGRIGVISSPGAGSRFWFEVPAAQN